MINPGNSAEARTEEGMSRTTIYRSSLGAVEELVVTPAGLPDRGFSQRPVIAHCQHGMFDFWSGRQHATFDGSRLLMLSSGREFRERHPLAGQGHRAFLFVPSDSVIDETQGLRRSLSGAKSHVVGHRFAMLSARWRLHQMAGGSDVALDELYCATIAALALDEGGDAAPDNVLVNRAKAILNADLSVPASLVAVAQRLRVSPNYLTHCFTRAEGVPLYRYHLNLRLQRALQLLPQADDLTGLALDLGFSGHSHFSAAFRRHFGMTPSAYRAETRLVVAAA